MGSWSNKPLVLDAIEFDGDSIVFEVKRLLVEDMQVLAKYFNSATGTIQFSSPLEVCQTAQQIFPKYVVGIAGLLKEGGAPMTAEEFIEASKEFYFVPLVGELFAKLISVSTIKSKEKNFAPPSLNS